MNLRPSRRDEPDINLTPLIDVVFLLLIFFMVSTTFNDDARLRLELPRAHGEPAKAGETQLVELVVDVAGRYYVDGQQVLGTDAGTLRRALAEVVKGDKRDLPVLIKADAKTPHQAVMTALDALGQLGISHVAFAASHSEGTQ
ncbi:MAG: biopolymer transporter ExbD [Thiohalocapsa sp.]|jgi:biopolymer transport protein ExbD|uniref:ExbD/TolR family protein n=1 Tax=Thiohalocapsa sp. TaxID=2497641 RepID=UPI0025F9B89A|nr:biopolymer transporter ExbD [Thiohalocapsa sp.]MCG6940066.1 biopolymer transporter ExbD [Thiohalocapsa sp.]